MRPAHATPAGTAWLRATLDARARGLGTRVDLAADTTLTARPPG